MDYITLNNGLKMLLLGFGTMNIFDEEECTKILKEAYEEGYRLFDYAQIYGNEQIVGSALRKAGIPRDEIFLTTKVWFTNFEGEEVRKSLLESMRKLQTDYFDLVFIHWPYGNTYHAYRELEKMYEEGFIKSIGISIYEDDKVKSIALKYNKTTRQIAMKYLVQNRISVITRPMEKQYMKDNLNLFDFQLNEEEMSYLSSFDLLEYNTKPSQDYQRTKSMLENM